MKIVHIAPTQLEAYVLQELLRQNNVTCEIVGEHLQGIDKIQSDGFTEVAVLESQFEEATKLVQEFVAQENQTTKSPLPKKHNSIIPLLIGVFIGGFATLAYIYLPMQIQKFDRNSDGKTDFKRTFIKRQISHTELDRNYDGKMDFEFIYDSSGLLSTGKADDNFNGTFETRIDFKNENYNTIKIDSDENGKTDTIENYENDILNKITFLNETTGKPVKVIHYSPFRLISSEMDTNNDGVLDTTTKYDGIEEPIKIKHN